MELHLVIMYIHKQKGSDVYNSYHVRMSSVVLEIPICDPLSLAHSMPLPIKSVLRMTFT